MVIRTFKEAQDASKMVEETSKALSEFWARFHLGALGDVTIKAPIRQTNGIAPKLATPLKPKTDVPATIGERVLELLSSKLTGPVGLKELREAYEKTGWPQPRSGKLHTSVASAAYYLTKNGKLKNEGGKYSLAEVKEAERQ